MTPASTSRRSSAASSTTSTSPCSTPTARGGRYTYRVIGFANLQTDFQITSKQIVGGESAPAALGAIQSGFRDAQRRQVDFDGALTLYWGANGCERGFEVERSADGGGDEFTLNSLLRVTANPLTRTVSAKLVRVL